MHRVPRPDEDADMHRASIGHQAEAVAAVVTNWPDVATPKAVQPNEGAHRLHQVFWRKWDLETVHCCRRAKSLQMRVGSENRRAIVRFVAADSFEHSRTVVQGMG